MRKKVHSLNFIPQSINFSELEPFQVDSLSYTEEHPMIEDRILQMMYSLETDKQRCVFMFQLLREYGFEFDHESCAKAIGVEWRWYMRIKAKIQKKLRNE